MRTMQILALTLLPISAALISGCNESATKEQAAAPAPVEVSVATVLVKPLADWDEFTGRLEAVDTVGVKPRVGGYVESVGFTEGSRVKKGQLLFQIDSRSYRAEVDRLSAEQQRAKAQADLAVANRNRGQRLLEQNAISREEYERLSTEAAATAANVGAVDASLANARLNLEFTRVTAPITGRVSRALITQGNLVSSADLLTTLVSDEQVYAYFDADEQTYLRHSNRSGKEGPVYMGLSNEDGYPRQGRLDFIDNRLDPRTGTIRGRAVFENPDGKLTPGLFARVRLIGGDTRERVLIDERSVGADLGKKYVLVLKPDNTLEYRGVTLGAAVDGLRVVDSGLGKGDVIVVNGLQHAKAGDTVMPLRVTMNNSDAQVLAQASGEPPTLLIAGDAAKVRSAP